ncbi:MAG: tRNA pseudouridine(38-40) synthase TruA [Spirochaetales bacterium]|nr:tRNA pseudouridine(38-40) synthase TruA [Spirochaetales bacterium]
MRTILARVAYDGTDFCGYQIQRGQRTVQGVVEEALGTLHDHPVATAAAGRTDSGVHAVGQHVSFVTDRDGIPADRMAQAINSRLPHDVRVVASREVGEGFHARFDARSRHYRYYVVSGEVTLPHLRRYAWRIPEMPDVVRMNGDAAALVGEHDFSGFASRREEGDEMVRRVLYADMRRYGGRLEFAIGADGFLWRMVRTIVGTLVERERARLRGVPPEYSMSELLRRRDRAAAGATAPAWGLFFHDVEYDA